MTDLATLLLQFEADNTFFAKANITPGGKNHTLKVPTAGLEEGDLLLVENQKGYDIVTFCGYDAAFVPEEGITYAWGVPLTGAVGVLT